LIGKKLPEAAAMQNLSFQKYISQPCPSVAGADNRILTAGGRKGMQN
jgi:hypothetical protein